MRAAALAALLLTPRLAAALDCADAKTQRAMDDCAVAAFKAADARLNAAYAKARAAMQAIDAGLSAPERGAEKALTAAQRAWIIVRDQTCTAEAYQYYGGSIAPLVFANCAADLTAARTKVLTDMTEEN